MKLIRLSFSEEATGRIKAYILAHKILSSAAIVVLAALMNALKAVGKDLEEAKVVVSGSGAAGIAVGRLLTCLGYDRKICTSVKEIVLCDSKGIVYLK